MKKMLMKINDEHQYDPDANYSGSTAVIAKELLDRFNEVEDLVIVSMPWCIEPMVYTLDEVGDDSLWADGCPTEYTTAEKWIEDNAVPA